LDLDVSLKILAGHERQVALPGTIEYFIGKEAELHPSP
jgi:hypothetical protein